MPLEPSQVDSEERKRAGREAALAEGATEPKDFGQTSPEKYPFTYWWVVGYNEAVTKPAKKGKK